MQHQFSFASAGGPGDAVIGAVVFDLDGVIVDSEQVWDAARERGGRWHDEAQRDMMGMSSLEWSRYMHDRLGLKDPPEEEISAEVVRRLEATYREELPLNRWRPGGGRQSSGEVATGPGLLLQPPDH